MTQSPQGMVRLNINIDEQLHSAFKAAAALQGRGMTDLLVEFIETYVRQHIPPGPRKGKRK